MFHARCGRVETLCGGGGGSAAGEAGVEPEAEGVEGAGPSERSRGAGPGGRGRRAARGVRNRERGGRLVSPRDVRAAHDDARGRGRGGSGQGPRALNGSLESIARDSAPQPVAGGGEGRTVTPPIYVPCFLWKSPRGRTKGHWV